MSRDKIIRYYQASGDADTAAKLFDLAEGALRSQKYKVTEFVDPYNYSIAETISAHFKALKLISDGGYATAERVRAAFVHTDFMGTVELPLAAVNMEFDPRYYQLSHRDVLGSMLAAGLKREVIGDIIMLPNGCQVLVDPVLVPFVVQEVTRIGAAPVTAQAISLSSLSPKPEQVKEVRATVAALRLDAVAATGFGTSRSKMAADITAAKLKLNWQDAKNSAQLVKQGDIISMRGRGRLEVAEVVGQTKKGRISVVLKRFL